MTTATQPFAGTYVSDPIHSSFGFAARYMGVSTYRGTFDEVTATLTSDESGARLEGTAKVESISIRTPEQFRAHVLSDEFFGAEKYPEVKFVSDSVDLRGDGTATVAGELTIRDTTLPVAAAGTWVAPAQDAFGGTRTFLQLSAVIDRTQFGLNWNMPLPTGGNALANEVTLTVDLVLVQQQD